MSAAEEWTYIQLHPEVREAQRALDELEERERELSLDLGRAIRRAQEAARTHLESCDPWQEPCGACGRLPVTREHGERSG